MKRLTTFTVLLLATSLFANPKKYEIPEIPRLGPENFVERMYFTSPSGPLHMMVHDIDGDGREDLVIFYRVNEMESEPFKTLTDYVEQDPESIWKFWRDEDGSGDFDENERYFVGAQRNIPSGTTRAAS